MAVRRQWVPARAKRNDAAFIRSAEAERQRLIQDKHMRRLQLMLAIGALFLAVNALTVMLLA